MTDIPTGIERPSIQNTIGELSTPLELLGLGRRARELRLAPDGDGRSVMLLPGYGSSPRAMYPLARFLRAKNYDVSHWGLGANKGEIYDYVELIGERLRVENGEPITLIGWSLGGVVAREVARLYEPYVREIITMATPVIGGPKYTVVGDRFAKQQELDLDTYEEYVHSINSIGLNQPITAFYTKRDGIVGWQAAIDTYNPQTRNIEVDTTHLGIGVCAKVWIEIAETLASS